MACSRLFATILAVLLSASLPILRGQQRPSVSDLLGQFESEKAFWRQFEIAKAIAAAKDASILPKLEPWLTHRDRHLRGNAAFIFAELGDRRGFDTIVAILNDRTEDRAVEKISSVGLPSAYAQIREDRYYAAHLLGDLKDPRAIPILAPLLTDPDVSYIVPWSLDQTGDPSAIPPLIAALNDPDPSMRVLAIYALVELKATGAIPRLRELLNDNARSTFDKLEPVSDAAKGAIAHLEPGAR